MKQFNITELFFDQAKKTPDTIAIIDGKATVSFVELANEVQKTAQYFLSKGIQKGDRVLVFVPMSIPLYRIVLALFQIGAVAVFLDEWVSKKRLEVCTEIADCKAIIGGIKVRLLSIISKPIRKIPIHLGIHYKTVSSPIETESSDTNDTALITFTTGSTGIPKAAKRTHGFLLEQFKALEIELESQAGTISMTTLPIVLFMNLGQGNTSIIASFNPKKIKNFRPQKVVQQLQKYQVNTIIASPYFVQIIAQYTIDHTAAFQDLKKIFTGGAPVFPSVAATFIKAFPDTAIRIVYGSTESEPISSIDAPTLLKYEKVSYETGLNVGIPAEVTEVRIIQYIDEPVSLNSIAELDALNRKEAQIGEIIVAGKHVLDAYYNNEAALKRNKIFIEGKCWHRTGDSGFLKDGYLYLTGRCDMLIKMEDHIIAPFIVENQLQDIKGITIGTIIAFKNLIYILVEKEKTADTILITKEIEDLKIPYDRLLFIRNLPRDPRHHSKIDYGACTQLLQ